MLGSMAFLLCLLCFSALITRDSITKPGGRAAMTKWSLIHCTRKLYFALFVLCCLALVPFSSALAESAECGSDTIKMADQNWESAAFTTHVIRLILEHGYGCEVEIVPGATAAVESALVQNDVQIIAEQWSGRSPIIEEGLKAGQLQIVGDTLKGGAEQ